MFWYGVTYWLNISMFLRFYLVLEKFYDRRRRSTAIVVLMILVGAFGTFILDYVMPISVFKFVLNLAVVVALAGFVYKTKPAELLSLYFLETTVSVYLSNFIIMFIFLSMPDSSVEMFLKPGGYRLLAIVVSEVLSFVYVFRLRHYLIKHTRVILVGVKNNLVWLAINNLMIMFLFQMLSPTSHWELSTSIAMVMVFVFILITLMLLKMIAVTTDAYKTTRLLEREKLENDLKSEHFQTLESVIETLKRQRHEFNNQLNCAAGLADLKRYDALEQYLSGLLTDTARLNQMVDCGNPMVTAIVNQKYEAAKKASVSMRIESKIRDEIRVHPVDLSMVLSNLMDNAIEAASKANEKWIDVALTLNGSYFVVEIKNAMADHIVLDVEAIHTTKFDKDNHGFGLKNIKQVVERYDGFLDIEHQKGLFGVSMSLLNEPSDVF